MHFVFKGDPADPKGGPGSVDLFGYHFPMNEPVKVDEKDKRAIAKLEGNSHFEKADGRKKADKA